MNSIDRRQTEDNHRDLEEHNAVEKIKALVHQSKTCFFCTGMGGSQPLQARPMSVQKVDDDGNLWFLSAADSHKNEELETDHAVTLLFQGSSHSGFLQLNGSAFISRDRAKIEELWEPIVKTWFTEGKDDPRITVIKVTPQDGYYWDTKHGPAVAGLKMMLGAMLGKTMDDSIQGRLTV